MSKEAYIGKVTLRSFNMIAGEVAICGHVLVQIHIPYDIILRWPDSEMWDEMLEEVLHMAATCGTSEYRTGWTDSDRCLELMAKMITHHLTKTSQILIL